MRITARHRPRVPTQRPGFWQSAKVVLLHQFSGITIAGIAGTLIVAYFQNLSAYHDRVTNQAKQDLSAATEAFTAASDTLSNPIVLQDQLFNNFMRAATLKASGDANALTSKTALDLYKSYSTASSALRENVNLLARKMELYLDWPSDPDHDPANNETFGDDPITTSFLGTVDFDCDKDMPRFNPKQHTVKKTKNDKSLTVDWYSSKHHVLTIAYCFDVTQQKWMETVRRWASQSSIEPREITDFAGGDIHTQLHDRLDSEVIRLNAFMSRAMREIEQIRIKYRPNGYWCSVPVAREALGKDCLPVRVSEGQQRPVPPPSR